MSVSVLRVKKLGWLVCVFLAGLCASATQTSTSGKKNQHPRSLGSHRHSATTTKASSSRKSTGKGKHGRKKAASYKSHGQQKIDPKRAQQIQEALIQQHYLSGEASGTWDDATQKAMQKFQADNGWQNKTTPDSRALIKLGLGPDHDHLLNPDSAMTTPPQSISSSSSTASAAEKQPPAQGRSTPTGPKSNY